MSINRSRRFALLERLEAKQLLHGGELLSGPVAAAVAEGEGSQVPDFSLLDVNPNSSTYNTQISPRDYLGGVSAWYFGHAT